MKFKINITKEVLELSKMCNINGINRNSVGQNCAIGKAIVDIFGLNSWVNRKTISFYDSAVYKNDTNVIHLPIGNIQLSSETTMFIDKFDTSSAEDRVLMTPFSFEIDVPDTILEQIIDISEITTLLAKAPYMELV